MTGKALALFGGEKAWNPVDWTASDDRVRGGKSQSYLHADSCEEIATFYGDLDIKTLGGAGFASQRTTADNITWDLSGYDGIALSIASGDAKRYTFTIRDELLPPDPNTGREQSSLVWEHDFTLTVDQQTGNKDTEIYIPWANFTPTYRGRPKEDAKALDLKNIKRYSLMMRSFFGTQEGSFKLALRSISAVKKSSEKELLAANERRSWTDVESGRSGDAGSIWSRPLKRAGIALMIAACLIVGLAWCGY